MKTVVFIFALLAFAACQGVKPKGDAKTGAPATAPTPAPKPAASGDAKKPAAKPATPAKDAKKDDKKPAAPAKADDKKKPAAPAKDAKKDDKKAGGDKKPAAPAKDAKKDDGKSGAKVVYADRHKPNCCLRSKTDGRYYPAICGHRRFLQAVKPADKKPAPTTRNDGAQTFYCPKQTNPVLNTPAATHPAPKNGSAAPAPAAKRFRRMQAVKPKEDFTCKAYARRLQAVPAPAPKADDKKDDKKPAPAPKADDKKKTDDKKPAAPAKDDKKKADDKKPATPAKDDKKKPAAPAKDDKKKPASNMPVTCGSKVYGTVTYTCMTTTKRDVCLYTAP